MDADQELRSLRRGLLALTLINQAGALSIASAAARLELPRTTAERILNTLAADGYVQRSTADKKYRPTSKVLALSSGFSSGSWITHVAAPMLNSLTEEIGWPLAIAVAEGANMRLHYTTDTMTSLWLNRRRIGASIAIPEASAGTVHLGFASEAERAQMRVLIERTYPTMTVDWAGVDRARATGYAFPPTETREQSISLPILLDGRIAAVLLMVFMARVHSQAAVVDQYLPRLRALATAISDAAGTSGQGAASSGERSSPAPSSIHQPAG